jgi:hypothetical protein
MLSFSQAAQHGSHPVQFNLSLTTFIFFQTLADNQNILDCRALQCRASRDLEIASPVHFGSLSCVAKSTALFIEVSKLHEGWGKSILDSGF